MLEVFFGWRKTSTCKKLIRRVQCRLKLLKNKRSSILRQLRDDVAQLLKHGHEQNAFDRVEQLFLDESIVEVYDLLHQFCEFIVSHLSYIRKHKDFTDDIGEALSTLIFASARCGDLPELLEIRKLFAARYGHSFAVTALDLLPGNLVNRQIQEKLSIQSVSDDIKLSLVDEIWRSLLQTGPLMIEYYPNNLEDQAIVKWEDKVIPRDIQGKGNSTSISSELWIDSYKESSAKLPISSNDVKIVEKKEMDVSLGLESSSDDSSRWSKEFVYIDDIKECKSPTSTRAITQDQRLFMFKSSTDKLESEFSESCTDRHSSLSEKSVSKRIRKSKRQRRKSLSRESVTAKDSESTVDREITKSCFSKLDRTDHGAKNENDDKKFRGVVHECNLMKPCYFCTIDDTDGLENQETKMITTPNNSRSLYSIESKKSGKEEGLSDAMCNPYLRTVTMPPQRPNERHDENIVRSNSLPFQHSKTECHHVHPKLPDYDQLEATFTALKKANLLIKGERLQVEGSLS